MGDRREVEIGSLEVRDDPENRQYVVVVDGKVAGKAEYRQRGDIYLFVHTEVDPEYQDQGVANHLARFALDDVREQGKTLVPLCPFIAAFIRRYPEYDEIVDHELTDRLTRRKGDSD